MLLADADGAELLPYVPGGLTCCSVCVMPAKGWVTELLPTCGLYCVGGIFYDFFGIVANENKREGRQNEICLSHETQEPQNRDSMI